MSVVTTQEVSCCVLRKLIPFMPSRTVCGPIATFLREGFVRRPPFIQQFLAELQMWENIHLKPRMFLAECLQQLLEGKKSQAALSQLFQEAADCAVQAFNGGGEFFGVPLDSTHNPMARLVLLQIRMAAEFYAEAMRPGIHVVPSATLLTAQCYACAARDDVLCRSSLKYAHSEEFPLIEFDDVMFMREVLLLERFLFSKWRFVPRPLHQLRFQLFAHCLRLDDIEKSASTAALLELPVIKECGNFSVEKNRSGKVMWTRFIVRCLEDDLRVDSSLPEKREEIVVNFGGVRSATHISYTDPLLGEKSPLVRDGKPWVLDFELPVLEDEKPSLLKKLFSFAR